MAPIVERRRTPRTLLAVEETVDLEMAHRVRLVDISHTGVLLACDSRVAIGTSGRVSVALDGEPFNAEVTVKRHFTAAGARQIRVGAAFAAIENSSRAHLERFLKRAHE